MQDGDPPAEKSEEGETEETPDDDKPAAENEADEQ
jgi:hypothetical protein